MSYILINQGDVMKDPTREEMVKAVIGSFLKNMMSPDELNYSLEIAIYWFSHDWHSGISSNLYSVLSTSEYRPGRMETGIGHEGNESAETIYNHLFNIFKEDGDVYEKEEEE
jgi:hypothetical protein